MGWDRCPPLFFRGDPTLQLSPGDTIYAGGDGNDWFTSTGQMVWGTTTGPEVNTRPYAVMKMDYQETITQEARVQVNIKA